jgi:hypothetical protein
MKKVRRKREEVRRKKFAGVHLGRSPSDFFLPPSTF